MGKYSQYERKGPERQYDIHPIWRGIGFMLIILIFIISVAAAAYFSDDSVASQEWVRQLPYALRQSVTVPFVDYRITRFGVKVIFTILFAMGLYSFLALLYAVIYRVFGPRRYRDPDVPPQRPKYVKAPRKKKKKRRR